jgi:hypothetical protein
VNERFIRCTQCGLPHQDGLLVCPLTRKPIERRTSKPKDLGNTQRQPLKTPADPAPRREATTREPVRRPAPSSPSITTNTSMPSMSRNLIGKTIGDKYQIKSILGDGGMGTVFEAVNVPLGRLVAVKILHASQLRKKDAVKRFHQEARSAGAIGHPNICEVYDLGTLSDGCPYLVMEKLVGETLADRIANEGGLPFDDVMDVMTQVLSGLHAAHEKAIIHRDIKPENVFLTRRVGCPPVAKLLDFGVSKMMSHHPQEKEDSELDMTRTGIVLGTPYYLAPEQARGDRNLDARVDLYACGVMLYEALTGKRPFTGSNYNALLINILTGAPRPARELRPALPADLDLVLDKAMARERHQRYQTAVDFQADLLVLGGKPHPSAGGSQPVRPAGSKPRGARADTGGTPTGRTALDRKGSTGRRNAPMPRGDDTEAKGRETLLRALPVDPLARLAQSSRNMHAAPGSESFRVPQSEGTPTSKGANRAAPAPPAPSGPPRPAPSRRMDDVFDDMPTEVSPPSALEAYPLPDDDGEGDDVTMLIRTRDSAPPPPRPLPAPPPRPAAGRPADSKGASRPLGSAPAPSSVAPPRPRQGGTPASSQRPSPPPSDFDYRTATDVMTPEVKGLLNRPLKPSPPREPDAKGPASRPRSRR